jgi:catalase
MLQTAGTDFLEQALIARTAQGAVRWDMLVSVGQPGDPDDDPTIAWPAERREFRAGTLSIVQAMPQTGAACEPINFDPLVMADGIAPAKTPSCCSVPRLRGVLRQAPERAVSQRRQRG